MHAKPALRGVHGPCMLVFAIIQVLSLFLGLTAGVAGERAFRVVESALIAVRADGTVSAPEALIGMALPLGSPENGGYSVRINAIQADPYQPILTLYDVSYFNPTTNAWEPLCYPGPHGLALAVPIPGYWRRDGTYQPLPDGQFTFTCTAGAHVKCLRMGYYPWASTPDGASLTPYHQACTRMMRADYCGNGTPFTVAGKRIQVIDTTGRRAPPLERYGAFEAVWGVEGAVCVRRPRVPDQFPLDKVLQVCTSLREHVGKHCNKALLHSHPKALIANWSSP